jgi:hypothetical protein
MPLHLGSRAGGVVVIESGDIFHARLKAALAGAARKLEFPSFIALQCM